MILAFALPILYSQQLPSRQQTLEQQRTRQSRGREHALALGELDRNTEDEDVGMLSPSALPRQYNEPLACRRPGRPRFSRVGLWRFVSVLSLLALLVQKYKC